VSLGTEATKAVVFDVARPSANYTVVMDQGIASVPYTTSKSASGFTITFSAPVIASVYWTVLA
jgi:hypothetical protein